MGWQGVDITILASKTGTFLSDDDGTPLKFLTFDQNSEDIRDLFFFEADPDDTDWEDIEFELNPELRASLEEDGFDLITVDFQQNNGMGKFVCRMKDGSTPIDNMTEHRVDLKLSDIDVLEFNIKSRHALFETSSDSSSSSSSRRSSDDDE